MITPSLISQAAVSQDAARVLEDALLETGGISPPCLDERRMIRQIAEWRYGWPFQDMRRIPVRVIGGIDSPLIVETSGTSLPPRFSHVKVGQTWLVAWRLRGGLFECWTDSRSYQKPVRPTVKAVSLWA